MRKNPVSSVILTFLWLRACLLRRKNGRPDWKAKRSYVLNFERALQCIPSNRKVFTDLSYQTESDNLNLSYQRGKKLFLYKNCPYVKQGGTFPLGFCRRRFLLDGIHWRTKLFRTIKLSDVSIKLPNKKSNDSFSLDIANVIC